MTRMGRSDGADDPKQRSKLPGRGISLPTYVAQLRAEYEADIDILRLASDLVIDAIVEPERLRTEIVARLAAAATKDRRRPGKRHGVPPV